MAAAAEQQHAHEQPQQQQQQQRARAAMRADSLPPPHLAALLTDAHCHPTDDPRLRSADAALHDVVAALHTQPLRNVCIMASSVDDQHLVRHVAHAHAQAQAAAPSSRTTIVPAFGHHPWFVHRISLADPPLPKREHYLALFRSDHDDADGSQPQQRPDELLELIPYLPEPVALAHVLQQLRADLAAFPAAMLGEVGLDRSFRLPWPPEARAVRARKAAAEEHSSSSRRTAKLAWTLSSFTTPLAHQLAVLQAQMCIAIDLRRSVSFHSVKAPGATSDFFMHMTRIRPRGWGIGFSDINVDLHSCTISAPGIVQIQKVHHNIFVSFSTTINTRQKALHEQIRACDPHRLLAESDFNTALPYAEPPWRAAALDHDEDARNAQAQSESRDGPVPKPFPLARRTWAIVQYMAEALDVRSGTGPESGTNYGRRPKERKAAESTETEKEPRDDGGHAAGEERDDADGAAAQRQEALARLLAANWTRFHHSRGRADGSGLRRGSGPSTNDGSSPSSSASGSGVGLRAPSNGDDDDNSDSDDDWDPAARAEVLRQRQLHGQS